MDKLIQFPGLVDVHVHFREPGATQKEDFETGTKAAVAGGYTQVIDMPNNDPPTTTLSALKQKISLAKNRIWCDLGFHFGATHNSSSFFKKTNGQVFGLKVYMNKTTGPLLVEKDTEQEIIFRKWSSSKPILVHAEGEEIEIAIKLAKKNNRRLHVCHVTPDQIGSIIGAKKHGLHITCEVCPHHLFLTQDDIKNLGPFGMTKPPLLSKKDQQKLWDNLDKIDIISTDHAPHTKEEKQDLSSPKFGVPGLETTLPLMLAAVDKGLISLSRLEKMLCANPRRIFNIPNQDETYVVVDTSKRFKISSKRLFTKCKWTPFANLEGRGEVVKVVLRSKTIFENGKFIGRPQGKVIFPAVVK